MNTEPTQSGLFNIPWDVIWDVTKNLFIGIGILFLTGFRWLRRWCRRFRALEKAVKDLPNDYVQYPTLERRDEELEVRLRSLSEEGVEREGRIIAAITSSKTEIKNDLNALTVRVDTLYSNGGGRHGQR